MHLSEFKAWFEGFTENMEGPPNKQQWARIQKCVEEITNDYIPAPVLIDRYIEPRQPYWTSSGSTSSDTITGRDDWVAAGAVEYSTLNG